MTFLETAIKDRGMTIRQFSQSADVPYATLYDVVKGKRPLGGMAAVSVCHIAHALDTSVEELLEEKPPALSADEAELLKLYRSAPGIGKRAMMALAQQFAEEYGTDDDQ